MLIVIEGCDRTGKTSFARAIAEVTGAAVRHAGKPDAHPLELYEASLMSYDPRVSDDLVLDRFHIGEHVWPAIFKRPTELTEPVARHIELFMRSRGAWYVWAQRNDAKLRYDVAMADPPEPIFSTQVGLIQHAFGDAFNWAGKNVTTWDFDRMLTSVERDLTVALAKLEEQDVSPIWDIIGGQWIGNDQPSVLLVGEGFGPEQPGRSDIGIPFVPWRNTSGYYLMRALPDEWWRDCAIVNAYTDRSLGRVNDLAALAHALGEPPVVALGNLASDALFKQDIPHTKIPHPQYWRRFHHDDIDDYTIQLQKGAA